MFNLFKRNAYKLLAIINTEQAYSYAWDISDETHFSNVNYYLYENSNKKRKYEKSFEKTPTSTMCFKYTNKIDNLIKEWERNAISLRIPSYKNIDETGISIFDKMDDVNLNKLLQFSNG